MKTETICHEVPCDQGVAERPRYYARQLITPDDLTLEQEYFRTKLRLHNRMLHGWGVVCGAEVCLLPKSKQNGTNFEPWKVIVKPGYILGPYGDEIVIDCCKEIDVRLKCVTGVTGQPCVEVVDPWCAEVFEHRDGGIFHIAVRYKEMTTRPVRVHPIGCGCDDTHCEYSRIQDGYEICVLDDCPDSHHNPPDIDEITEGPNPTCPPCPDEPWVVLAEVHVDPDGKITKINNCACRRIVLSFGNFWRTCEEPETGPDTKPDTKPDVPPTPIRPVRVIRVEPQNFVAGTTTRAKVVGENLDMVKELVLSNGASMEFKLVDNQTIEAAVKIDTGATGSRTLGIVTSDGTRSELPNAISITAATRPSPTPPPKSAPKRGGRKKPEEDV